MTPSASFLLPVHNQVRTSNVLNQFLFAAPFGVREVIDTAFRAYRFGAKSLLVQLRSNLSVGDVILDEKLIVTLL
jgi:hypothetical protein